jgi:hypothetical protein
MRYSKQKQNRVELHVSKNVCLAVNTEEAKGAAGIIFDQVTAYTADPSGRAV